MAQRRRLQSHSGTRRLQAGSASCCVGHRGARAFAPENTLTAFRKAAAMGCAAVELDVHLSRDGEAVVHHDERLARCTDVRRRFPGRDDRLADFTLAELQALDAGSWYAAELARPAERRQPFLRGLTAAEVERHVTPGERTEYAGGGVRIPTLAEVLRLARSLDLIVNIEIKTPSDAARRTEQDDDADDGLAARVVAAVAEMDMQHSVLVSSFDQRRLVAVRRLDAAMPTGVLTSSRVERPLDELRRLDADAYHPGLDALGFGAASATAAPDTPGIEDVRAAGYPVFVWTCNQVAQIRALMAAGVTGVITDYPNRFAAAAAIPGG